MSFNVKHGFVHLVLFCAKNGGEIIGHGEFLIGISECFGASYAEGLISDCRVK